MKVFPIIRGKKPPPIEGEVGEETPLSESECFKEERTTHDLDTECPPLIDPWYDTHSYFPVIPNDYSPFLSSCVWLSLELQKTDTSWASLAYFKPDLAIRRGETLLVPILFKFRSGTSLGWKDWVYQELSDVGFMEVVQRAGVLKTIVSSRCLRHLVRWWCSATHMFFLSCGVLIVTLEDMAKQLLLLILGDADTSNIKLFLSMRKPWKQS